MKSAGVAVIEGQTRENEVATAVDIKNAKGRRAAAGAALDERAVAMDRELMAAVGSDGRQTIESVVPNCQDVGSVRRQFNRVVLRIAVGRGDGALESSDIAIGDVESSRTRILRTKKEHRSSDRRPK